MNSKSAILLKIPELILDPTLTWEFDHRGPNWRKILDRRTMLQKLLCWHQTDDFNPPAPNKKLMISTPPPSKKKSVTGVQVHNNHNYYGSTSVRSNSFGHESPESSLSETFVKNPSGSLYKKVPQIERVNIHISPLSQYPQCLCLFTDL